LRSQTNNLPSTINPNIKVICYNIILELLFNGALQIITTFATIDVSQNKQLKFLSMFMGGFKN